MLRNKKRNSRGFASVLALIALVAVGVAAIAISRSSITRRIEGINAQSVERTITLNPTEDAYVSSLQPSRNFGTQQTLSAGNRSRFVSYLKFNLSSIAGKNLTSAKFKFKVTEGSTVSYDIQVVTGNWSERAVTYRNRPSLGAKILSFTPVAVGNWNTIDLTRYLPVLNTSNIGTASFAITSSQSDSFNFYSKESIEKPVLEFIEVVSVTPSPTTRSTPTGTPVSQNQPVITPNPSMTSAPVPTGTPAPNGTSPDGGFGVGSGEGSEIGINLAKFNQAKKDAAAGVYDRACTAAEHDNTKWHGLVNTVAKCHYDHEHGDDPNYVNDVFGTPGAWFDKSGQSISYPWQTFGVPSNTTAAQALTMFGIDGQKENDLKHPGYYWVVRRGQTCDEGQWCITDSRLQFHFMSSHYNEVGVRFHSFSFEGRLCKTPGDSSSCGIYRTGGWTDHGQLFVSSASFKNDYLTQPCWNLRNHDPIQGQIVPLFVDNQFYVLNGSNGLIDEFRCHKIITDAMVKSMPNGLDDAAEPPTEWWTHGGYDFRYVIRVFDPISNVDTMSPSGLSTMNAPYCKQGDPNCRWNNSRLSAGQGYVTQIAERYYPTNTPSDANGDGRTDLSAGKLYMTRFGDANSKCTRAGLDCIPMIVDNVILNQIPAPREARYANRQCEKCVKLDHDLTPAGRPSWIDWFYKM